LQLSLEDRGEAVKALRLVRSRKISLVQACEHYISFLDQNNLSKPFMEVLEEYLKHRERVGIKKSAQQDVQYRLNRIGKTIGEEILASIPPVRIEKILHGLQLSPTSINNFRKVLRSFFEFAFRRGYVPTNPITKIDKLTVIDKPPAIFTVQELRLLLDHTPVDMLPALTLGAFAGLRTAEIHRLEWRDIDLQRGFINIGADKSKTARRRLVKIEPVLAAWLAPYEKEKGKIWPFTSSYWQARLKHVLKTIDIKQWPDNGLRHSYASYWLAKYLNANELALQMGHSTTDMIFHHYREIVHPDQAEQYWNLFPSKTTERLAQPITLEK